MSKQLTIEEAVASIKDKSLLALGGNALHRSPIAFVKELIRQDKKELAIIKTAGSLDVDLLAGAESLRAVYGGYIGFEMYGLAPQYRKGVQAKKIKVQEHACASVIAALRASIYGIPFQPINGFQGSELPQLTGLVKDVICPFTKKQTKAVQALTPDATIIHVNKADEQGNAYIDGAVYEDLIMLKAAKRVFVTAETIISSDEWDVTPQVQGFLVEGVIHAEHGAAPGSCAGNYQIDEVKVKQYLQDPHTYIEEVKGGQVNV